jgi:integrase
MARKDGKDRGILEYPPKSGKWFVRIWVNGREARYRCSTKSEAKALYGRLKSEQRSGKYFEKPKTILFRDVAEDYITRVDARRRRKGDDKSRIDRWLATLGHTDINKITPRDIERVLTALSSEGYQPGSVLRFLGVVKAILNDAKRLGLLKENPATRVKPPKVNNVLVRYLTPDQEATLLEGLPAKYRPIVIAAVNTGCRQGELLRLTWGDVDWNTGIITIRETKTGDSRRIPMNSLIQGLLSDMQKSSDFASQDRIFPLDARYLRRAFDKAVNASNLAPFRFHDLRHTFASRLAMQGANDRTLMALGGWKSPAMLSRYAHLSPTHLWAAVEGLTTFRPQNSDGTVTKTVTDQDEGVEGETQVVENTGEPPATRTQDPRLKRAMLYLLS